MEPSPPEPGRTAGTRAQACERIRKHLEHGAPWDACDAFREEVTRFPGDAELLYWGALAHARAGAASHAHALLTQARAKADQAPERMADILSLQGRLWKDAFHRAGDRADASELAERARKEYLAAYALQRDPYPGINAATLSMLLGDRPAARKLAQEVIAKLAAETAQRTVWDNATAGEAQLLLGQNDQARASYADAVSQARRDAGTVATMRRQVRLLARVLPEAADVLQVLPAASVVAFAGHMIDAPNRAVPRFPATLEPAVAAAIRAYLAGFNDPIIYTSAACGADLICVEVALDLGAEVNVVMPFDQQEFVRTSVAVGGEGWARRFDRALAKATRVIHATEESHLGDDVLFEHAALLVEGLAVMRASQLETSPLLLCVIDADAAGQVGGTQDSFERWKRYVGPPDVIDLRELRSQAARDTRVASSGRDTSAVPAATHPPDGSGTSALPEVPDVLARPQRTVKTLLFADFAGYSRLHDTFAPLFQGRFWKIASDEIDASPNKPLMTNSWGDALYVVFESPSDGADFALRLLKAMSDVDWTVAGLPDSSQIRIALHAGPVFRDFDPFMGRDNYFGSSVTRAARMEPVTPPGMVYASEAFAATLAAAGQNDYVLEYIGQLALAKAYGESRIYRLDRR